MHGNLIPRFSIYAYKKRRQTLLYELRLYRDLKYTKAKLFSDFIPRFESSHVQTLKKWRNREIWCLMLVDSILNKIRGGMENGVALNHSCDAYDRLEIIRQARTFPQLVHFMASSGELDSDDSASAIFHVREIGFDFLEGFLLKATKMEQEQKQCIRACYHHEFSPLHL